ncbi:hypothetical protein QE152_g4632 [Popillia japonica]|uniref:Uncharacterized protein n=1 Tax=Popillia japonica TaxID=7064 RepID=A0AAW1N0Z2_POPJA
MDRNPEKEKPDSVVDYNKCKSFIDLSNQIIFNYFAQWYKMVPQANSGVITGVKHGKCTFTIQDCDTGSNKHVNAHLLYRTVTGSNMSITEFREQNALSLMHLETNENLHPLPKPNEQHKLVDVGTTKHLETNENLHPLPKPNEQHKLVDVGTTNRRRGVSCYSKISGENGRNVAATKTPHSRWKCMSCNKFYCVTCFCDAPTCTL